MYQNTNQTSPSARGIAGAQSRPRAQYTRKQPGGGQPTKQTQPRRRLRRDLFAAVKASVTAAQAAALYGYPPDRRGMVCCPFHGDRHPSMKVDERFHCFACQADGDAVDFVARLFGLSPLEAAKKLAEECGLPLYEEPPLPAEVTDLVPIAELLPRLAPGLAALWRYQRQLELWQRELAPKTPEEPLDPRYCEALHRLPWVRQLLADLSRQTPAQQREWLLMHREEVEALEALSVKA